MTRWRGLTKKPILILYRAPRPAPQWPDGTQTISQLRVQFRLAPQGMFAAMAPPKTLHLDIVDYLGEWLLDLGLLNLTYHEWLSRRCRPPKDGCRPMSFVRN